MSSVSVTLQIWFNLIRIAFAMPRGLPDLQHGIETVRSVERRVALARPHALSAGASNLLEGLHRRIHRIELLCDGFLF